MTLKNERGAGMNHPDAPPKTDDARREPSLRIVHSADKPIKATSSPRPAWAANYTRPSPVPEKREAMLDRALQARIGGMLRDVFSDLADAPVPDRFVKLLEALEEKETPSE